RGAIDVDDDELGAAFLAGPHRVGHHVDLGVDRIGPPDHDAVGLRHLFGVRPGEQPGARDIAWPRSARADRVVLVRVAAGVAQPVDAVAMHVAHGARVVVGPDALRTVRLFDLAEARDDAFHRLVPADA